MINETVKKPVTIRPRRKVSLPTKRAASPVARTVRRPARAAAEADSTPPSRQTYYSAVGRRKEAVARVRLYPYTAGDIIVNQKKVSNYFPYFEHLQKAESAITETGLKDKVMATVRVGGGGTQAQAEAVRLGIARALVQFDPNLKKSLRALGFLTRDSRAKERKKYGLKRARRAPQFAKR